MSGSIQVERFLLGALLYVTLAMRAGALDPRMAIGRYGYDVWQTGQGLPQAPVMSITQTPDGYQRLGNTGSDSGNAKFIRMPPH
jgi:ligand-binding sensor domain-containing protein